ncbi:MAG: methylated-DNA--[protein]-cysteine S-methyltransferase [Spirochaetaceae bacterium]|nr:MAG: methylated-DNA--[protein]-cysteine S-methyltransferase [Spirochaetaceae bacterium]
METRQHVYAHAYDSPIGRLSLAVDKSGRVLSIGLGGMSVWGPEYDVEENKYACGELEYQLDRYFRGELREFSLRLRLDGTAFQHAVWSRLQKIEYGTTVTYGEIARKIGRRGAARAVGNAVACNPIPLLVPCHRVVPASGKLGNYALRTFGDGRGTDCKRRLLALEGALPPRMFTFSRISA